MARKYVPKNKKLSRKRRAFRRRRVVFKPQRILRTGFPKSTCVKLRYVDATSINPGLGTLGTFNVNANSCYAPLTAGGGHQPLGFDEWSTFYNHYVVIGSKITCHFTYSTSTTSSTASSLAVGVYLSDDSSVAASSFSELVEQGMSRYKIKPANMQSIAGGNSAPIVTCNYSAKKFYNVANVSDNVTRIGAPVTATPSDTAVFHIWAGDPLGSADLPVIGVSFKVEYIVLFSEPKELVQS